MSRRRDWKPRVEPEKRDRQGVALRRDGELGLVALHRWSNDKALHGQMFNGCCDCGLEHLVTFEVFRDLIGQFWLGRRSYRLPLKKKRKRKR